MTMFVPKFFLVHDVMFAVVLNWVDWCAVILLGAATVYFLIGAVRSHIRWEDEKELHRHHGGDAPPKTEIRKLP
jgi:hypothetical protein